MKLTTMVGFLMLGIAYVYSQFFRAFLPVLTPELSEQLGISQSNLATAASAWFIVFGLMQFPVGVMLDKLGPRRTVAYLFGIAGTAGVLLFALAVKPWMIIVAMALIGIGCAPVLMGTLYICARTFAPKQLAIIASWVVAFGNLGNLASAAPLAQASAAFGWRSVMFTVALSTALIALVMLVTVNDPEKQETDDSGLAGFLTLLKIKALWPILILGFILYAPVANLRGLWAGPYLANVFSADSSTIGQVTFAMGISMIVGSLAYGPLDKLFNTRKWIIVAGNIVVLSALVLLASYPAPSIMSVTILLVVVGLFGTGYGVILAHGRSFVPSHLTGRGVTLINFTTIFGAGAMQYVTGAIASSKTNPTSTEAYQSVFWTYAIILGIALSIYLLSKDSKPDETAN